MSHVIRARGPRGQGTTTLIADRDLVARYLEDAAHVAGHADGVAAPDSEAALVALLKTNRHVLAVGAQSSLTGGATPRRGVVISTSRLVDIAPAAAGTVRVGSGVTLDAFDEWLRPRGWIYPPVPTFTGATVGGVVATNAAGAATFKYGSTRRWVEGLTVVLAGGRVLEIERGRTRAHPDGYFEIDLGDHSRRVPVPRYRMPRVSKISAGYFAEPQMDLVDLFVGSEGTLGIVTSAALRILEERPALCRAVVPFHDVPRAYEFAATLRDAASESWRTGGRRGIDVASIEHMDARSLQLVREDGLDRAAGVSLPVDARMALLLGIELPPDTTAREIFEQIGSAREPTAPDTPILRFCTLLNRFDVLDSVEIAVPGDTLRHRQFIALRESVPAAVNARVGRAHARDARIEKTAGDLLVSFDQLEAFTSHCAGEMHRRGLDVAIWGHMSDGNIHPNVIPRGYEDVEAGRAALLELGKEAIRRGGVPLAEHGVGRNPIKQRLLLELYGEGGVEEMRRTKRALDPEWKLAPGVIFAGEPPA
jgi:D-lactate dehydrogenase (cytochrome)